MEKIKALGNYFSRGEIILWMTSVLLIVISFGIFDRVSYMTLIASLIGVTSLIFNAKGNPFGQFLMLVFSALYGAISYTFAYYGEMITYLGMTAPMALFSLIAWLKNPYKGNKAEVEVNHLKTEEMVFSFILTMVVTVVFYFILAALHTSNLVPSTISVTTSFLAAYLTFRRSALYAIAYAANDVVLIVMWCMAAVEDATYISVVICFMMFLVNDIYGYISWKRIRIRQNAL